MNQKDVDSNTIVEITIYLLITTTLTIPRYHITMIHLLIILITLNIKISITKQLAAESATTLTTPLAGLLISLHLITKQKRVKHLFLKNGWRIIEHKNA